jgi:regulator of sirC expression with transglutaminase-like and TPR domain
MSGQFGCAGYIPSIELETDRDLSRDLNEAFAELAALPDDEMGVAEGALLLAAAEYPDLDIPAYRKRLEVLAAGASELVSPGADPLTQVEALCDFLCRKKRFRGNESSYYDPRNSYLNEVLDRRLGIPISLSIIYIETGRRLGMPLNGVNLPGHFVVRYDDPGHEVFIDVFNGGRLLTADDCRLLSARVTGHNIPFFGHYLDPVGTRAILIRMLGNLKGIYMRLGDTERAIRVLNRILTLKPGATVELKERAFLYLSGQRYRAALCDLMAYLTNHPDCPDADIIHSQIDMIMIGMGRNN